MKEDPTCISSDQQKQERVILKIEKLKRKKNQKSERDKSEIVKRI